MDKLEIVKARSFGDKFNELTSFIYDNFSVLWKWALAFVVPSAILMTALIRFMPDSDSTNMLKLTLCIVIGSVLSVVLNTLLVHHFEEGIELKRLPFKMYIAEILKNIALGIGASLLFAVIVSFMALVSKGLLDYHRMRGSIIFTASLYSLIISFFLIPVFYVLDAVIIENKSAGDAIKRAIQLIFHKPFMTIMFIFVMTIIGVILPSIATIPFLIVDTVKEIFTNDGLWLFSLESKPVWQFAMMALSVFCYTLTFLAVGVGMMFEYGNAVEKTDNVSFMKKFNNFENL